MGPQRIGVNTPRA